MRGYIGPEEPSVKITGQGGDKYALVAWTESVSISTALKLAKEMLLDSPDNKTMSILIHKIMPKMANGEVEIVPTKETNPKEN